MVLVHITFIKLYLHYFAIMILYNESLENCFYIVICAIRKNIMKEIGRLWNFATREFAEVNTRVESHVETIKPSEEYKDFADRHK